MNRAIINPHERCELGFTKSLQVLVCHFSPENDQNDHFAIIKSIHFPDAPDQKWGVQNDWLDKGHKMDTQKN